MSAKSDLYSGATQFVDIDNSREESQVKVMEQIIADQQCPFCLENLEKYHKQPILKESEHWVLTANQWPYKNTRFHFLAILKIHSESLQELPPVAGSELIELFQWLETEYEIPGGAWAMRFGDTNYSAGTVKHIHVQFIVPEINTPDFEPVRLKIGKG